MKTTLGSRCTDEFNLVSGSSQCPACKGERGERVSSRTAQNDRGGAFSQKERMDWINVYVACLMAQHLSITVQVGCSTEAAAAAAVVLAPLEPLCSLMQKSGERRPPRRRIARDQGMSILIAHLQPRLGP